jgi:glutamyl/glutaminyl-tRNA synthetase
VGGQYGPYRQSERKELYMKYVNKLVDDGLVYPCFCTDEELAEMKAEAERKSLPPIYRFVQHSWCHHACGNCHFGMLLSKMVLSCCN